MCGLVGIAALNAIQKREWLEVGRDLLIHRGPDDSGTYWSDDGRIGLGHRRLSILDLSPAGRQPMRHLQKDIVIVLNGEIYNHKELRRELIRLGEKFKSTSDTEVVLAGYNQWGPGVIDRIEGMYAFALYDGRQKKLYLVRDRAGEKPLFYHQDGGVIRFASELKALLADQTLPRHINPTALDCYLATGYVPSPLCILSGFKKLEAGHYLEFDLNNGNLQDQKYWSLPEYDDMHPPDDLETLTDELEELVDIAVNRQLVADVPVGLLLSGGVDSSLITAFAARKHPGIKTFTVGFRDHVEYDETKHAAAVANYYGTEHKVLQANRVDVNILERLVRNYDEPLIDSSMIPTSLLCEQIAQHCKVAIGGDGGDELFGGYYSASRMVWLQNQGRTIPKHIRSAGGAIADCWLPLGTKGRTFLSQLASLDQSNLPIFYAKFDLASRKRLMRSYPAWGFVAEQIMRARIPDSSEGLQRVTRYDFSNYLVDDILVKVDRASMTHSLEMRAPFLDRRVMEFAFQRVPSGYKATANDRKIILRKLAKRLLPPDFDSERKQGFSIPLANWLRNGDWRKYFEAVLFDAHLPYNRKYIDFLFSGIDRGRKLGEHLFGLVLLELWCREYHVQT